jgi:acyl transferase domain-containing protein
MSPQQRRDRSIAVTGVACRLPNADSPDEFWSLLDAGGSAVRELSADRLDRELYFDGKKGLKCKTYSSLGGTIPERPLDLSLIPNPDELRDADPCHQIFVEVAARACRDAGYTPEEMSRQRTAIYVGHSGGSPLGGELAYATLADETVGFLNDLPAFQALPDAVKQAVLAETSAAVRSRRAQRGSHGEPNVEANMVAGLVARALQLDGPHGAIDAACASSLVSLLLGAQAVESGEADVAIVGGASFVKADSLVLFSHAQSCSASGSRPFDAEADGLISSEGYVAILIQPLEKALAQGRQIHGIIRGIGMSSDGRGRSLWAPRKEGQVAAIRRAYGESVLPDLDYIEAHATSTRVGDATELEALAEVFGPAANGRRLPIGSVKSNIGHTLETAGLASLLKVLLAMRHGSIPPSINVTERNPAVDWPNLPFDIPATPQTWRRPAHRPRRAAVNAFGIGGLNVHLVVEEPVVSDAERAALQAPSIPQNSGTDMPIAVIGRGVILPGADSIESFDELLKSGRVELTDAPVGRWRDNVGVDPNRRDDAPWTSPTLRGGFIRDYEYDWKKHKIPPLQIARANPLQFMLLDATSMALREAGYEERSFDRSRASVVIGTLFGSEFGNQLHCGLRLPELRRDLQHAFARSGVDSRTADEIFEAYQKHFLKERPALLDETGSFTSSTLASRVGKTLDLMGGAMAIDAGDSSGFAALSIGCRLLRDGTSSVVLCGGAQRSMDLVSFETLALRRRLRPKNDESLPGEGVAVVVLKRLDEAQRDGDPIFGVIHGTGSSSRFEPAVAKKSAGEEALAQAARVESASNVQPQLESKGASLIRQIGHTQAAHGLVSLIQATLDSSTGSSKLGQTDPASVISISTNTVSGLTHNILLETQASRETAAKKTDGDSFSRGQSGSKDQSGSQDQAGDQKLHLRETRMTTDFQTSVTAAGDAWPRIVRFEAASLLQLQQQITACLCGETSAELTSFLPQSQVRAAIVASDSAQLTGQLELLQKRLDAGRSTSTLASRGILVRDLSRSAGGVAFLFPGQGSQYSGMFRELAGSSAAARQVVEEADELLQEFSLTTFSDLAWHQPAGLGREVLSTQTGMLIADLVMLAALKEVGLQADFLAGHSFGEFAALVAAGSVSLRDALIATQARSLALSSVDSPNHGMLAIHGSEEALRPLVESTPGLFISHCNSPRETVVAGLRTGIEQLEKTLRSRSVASTVLAVPCAYHTPFIAPAQAPFARALREIAVGPPRVPVLSSVGNRFVAEPNDIRDRLVAQLVEPVSWPGLVQRLADQNVELFVEVGPRQILSRLTQHCLGETSATILSADQSKRPVDAQLLVLKAAAEVFSKSVAIVGEHSSQPIAVSLPRAEAAPASVVEAATPTPQIEIFDATAMRRESRRGRSATPSSPPQTAVPAATIQPEMQHAPPPHSPAVQESLATVPAAASSASPAASSINVEELEQFLVDFVVEHTGYPSDVVTMDADLEADLGIDSIKRAQMLGELRELTGLQMADPKTASDRSHDKLNSLGQILEAVKALGKADVNESTAPPTVESPSVARAEPAPMRVAAEPVVAAAASAAPQESGLELEAFLVDFVVEHTGYPEDVVTLDADLEADLGIDSIKKAQLLGELRELTGLKADSGESKSGQSTLDELKTLAQIVAMVEGQSAEDSGETSPEVSPPPATEPRRTDFAKPVARPTPVIHAEPSPGRILRIEPAHAATKTPEVETPHYQTGLEFGRQAASQIRSQLRASVDQAWQQPLSNSLGLGELTIAPEISLDEADELRGIADGAGVVFDSVLGSARLLLDQCRSGSLPEVSDWQPGFETHAVDPPAWADAPANLEQDPLAETPATEKRTRRYVLRTPELAHVAGSPQEPVFCGSALIIGHNDLSIELAARLSRAGVEVRILNPSDDPQDSVQFLEDQWQRGPIPHLFFTTPRDDDAATSLDAAAWQSRRGRGVMTAFRVCQAWVQLVEQAGLMEHASLIGVTSLGGQFGFTSPVVSAESAAMAGLFKAICIESWVNTHRGVVVRVIDAAPDQPLAETVDAIWAELANPSHDVEVAWNNGRRHVCRAVPEQIQVDPTQTIRRGGTWVCTGGARGITAHVVKTLATRFGLKVHLLGTAPVPDVPDEWRVLEAESMAKLKQHIIRETRNDDRNSVKAYQDAEKAIEIDRTLRELREQGVRAEYHSCDVGDRDQLAQVLARIREVDGPIEGVLHGAGIGRDSRFDRKDKRRVEQCITAKVDGALALMDLTQNDPVKYFVGFGSISGRFGANGHTDYSLANDMLARLVGWYRQQRPEVAAVAFHWHAWGDVGMAIRPETKLALEMIDMQFMPAVEGVDHLVHELSAGAPEPEVLITDESYFRVFNPMETRIREVHASPLPEPVDTNRFPLLASTVRGPVETTPFAALLNPARDPFLKQHRIDDHPVLPMAVGIELLSEAALRAFGQRSAIRLRNVRAVQALKFFSDDERLVQVHVADASAQGAVCELTADVLNRDGRLVEADRVYLKGRVEPCGEVRPGCEPLSTDELKETAGWEIVNYLPEGSAIYHGPAFQGLRRFHTAGNVARGVVSAPALNELPGSRRRIDGWVIPSSCLDACFYLVALLGFRQLAAGPTLPVSIDYLEIGRLTNPGERCSIEVTFNRRDGRHLWFDFSMVGSNGDAIFTARDYCVSTLQG